MKAGRKFRFSGKTSPFKMLLQFFSEGQTEDESDIRKVSQPAYELLDLIGKGGFSTVHVARRRGEKSYECKYAAKVCDLLRSQKDPEAKLADEARSPKEELKQLRTRDAAVGLLAIPQLEDAVVDRQTLGKAETVTLPTPLELVTDEVKVLRSLQPSLFVVRLVDAFLVERGEKDIKIWIVMERLETSLDDVVWMLRRAQDLKKKERKKYGLVRFISIETISCIILEVIKALKVLRQRRVVHCDIKPGNILLSSVGNVKLCDFGIAKVIEEGEDYAVVRNIYGTPQYMASEMNTVGLKFDYSADIWSLGVVLFNLFAPGQMPWVSSRKENQYFAERMWRFWAKSNEFYFSRTLKTGFLNNEEFKTLRGLNGAPMNELAVKMNESAHKWLAPVYAVVRAAMVPKPKRGPKGDIDRENLLDRLTLDELETWCWDNLKGISELNRRSRLQNLVKKKIAIQQYFAKHEQSVMSAKEEAPLITL